MKKFLILIIFINLIILPLNFCNAGILDRISCAQSGSSGDCTLNDFIQIAVNISNFILGITGSLSLLAFVYGGIMFMVSGGSSDKVNQAKSIIIGSIVGLIIVFASYTIIAFVFRSLGVTGNEASWFSTPR